MDISPKNSREIYNDLLSQSIPNRIFYIKIAALLDSNPYFFSGYLEMLWNAEERGDKNLYNEILKHSLYIATPFFLNVTLRKQWLTYATKSDIEALVDLFKQGYESNSTTFFKKCLIKFIVWSIDHTLKQKTQEAPTSKKFLKKVCEVKIADAKKEILGLNPYWWQVETKRQAMIIQHQHTHYIVIRDLISFNSDYTPKDGIHESIPTEYTNKFSCTNNLILDLAKKLNICLGRVAIVRMLPNSQVYRHFDCESHLEGRVRYHLVISSGTENELESGSEKENVYPGELWLFDNKALHRACNKSSVPRIHIIFDGYKL